MDGPFDERVLILAPTGRDRDLLADALNRAQLTALACIDVSHLVREIVAGVSVAVLTEEALNRESIAQLQELTASQPPWSDIPILILMSSRTPAEERVAFATVESLGNVTIVRRPVSIMTLLSSVRAALRMRRRQYEIRGYVAQLDANNRAKDEFLAMLGHELRNPLAAVHYAVEIAIRDESRRARALEIAQRETGQLGRLIDDLLDVARITQGRITLHKERTVLGQILERSIESTRALIEGRNLTLTIAIPADPIPIDADAARLEQVFVNLLSNAGKYNEVGGNIRVTADREGSSAVVRIRDSGIGIAPQVLPRIWELFAQADRTLDRAQGGLGIGLTVVRRLVELHGGRVHAHSEGVGKGAEFIVHLPMLPTAEVNGSERSENTTAIRQQRILIVEDNSANAEALAMLFELMGQSVQTVHDGILALDVAKAKLPDVMFVDIGLPGIDGYEVARRVRRDPAFKHLVLVAITGYGLEADKQRAIESGFNYHLVKPVDVDELRTICAHLGTSEITPTSQLTT